MAKKQAKSASIVVEQFASPIGRPHDHRETLVGLGLNKIGRRKTLPDNPSVRGMVAKVAHLVRIVDSL